MRDKKMKDILEKGIPGAEVHGKLGITCQGVNTYEIRVRDHLETYWQTCFEGWSVTNLENGEVLLKGTGIDQSKLHGALNKIRDLNLTLLGVRCLPNDENQIG